MTGRPLRHLWHQFAMGHRFVACGAVVALVALYTAVAGSLHLWSLFNGVIVYVAIGVAFGCEYLLRRHARKRWTHA